MIIGARYEGLFELIIENIPISDDGKIKWPWGEVYVDDSFLIPYENGYLKLRKIQELKEVRALKVRKKNA